MGCQVCTQSPEHAGNTLVPDAWGTRAPKGVPAEADPGCCSPAACPVCSVTEEPGASYNALLCTARFAYLFGSGFGWDLESFLFLDSFLESFFVSTSAAEA